MSPVQIESGAPVLARPIVHESIEDETNTCACDACGGDPAGCEFCYRGRISGWRQQESPSGELVSTEIPCDAEQRAAVDRYLDDCDRECSLCDRRIPTTGQLLCARCHRTCEAHGALDRERARQELVA